MVGYLFLSAAVLAGAVKAFCGKKISGKTPSVTSAVLTNFVRMLFCIAFGFCFVCIIDGIHAFRVDKEVLLWAFLASVATCTFLVTWLLSMRGSAYMAVEAFVVASMLVPVLFSFFIYGNEITVSQIIGLALLLLAVVLMTVYNNKIKAKLTVWAFLLLLIMALANGFSSFLQQVFNVRFSVLDATGKKTLLFPSTAFNFYIYVFSAVILGVLTLVLWACNRKKVTPREDEKKEPLFDGKKLCYIAVMALCLFCNSYFVTLARGYIVPARLDPLLNGLAITVSMLMSTLFFKERLKTVSVVGFILIIAGMLFTSVIVF